jgi:hypothetical protein
MKQKQKPARRPKSDATFWRDGTYFKRPYWWWGDEPPKVPAGWKILARVLVLVMVAYGLAAHRTGTALLLAMVLGTAAGVYGVVLFRRLQDWGHDRTVVKPLAARVAGVLDQVVADRRSWLAVPQNYSTSDDAKIVVEVPPDFTAAERDMEDITRAVTVSTGWVAPNVAPELKSRHPRLVYTQRLLPPLSVGLPDILSYIEAAGPREMILGLEAGRDVTSINLDSEEPHFAFGGTTGSGKSEFGKNSAAQFLYHGGILIILDTKLVSHMWADGLPNVSYARTPDEIHDVMMWLSWDQYDASGVVVKPSELTRRKQVLLAARRGGVKPELGPPLLILAEERNATGRVLKRHWRRTGGRGGAPALEAIDETGETGRQLEVHVLHIAQRLSAKASSSDGSRDAMENIGAIVTKDPKEATWKLIADGYAQPPKSGHKGRYQLIRSDGVSEFQGVLYDQDPDRADAIARKLAMSGTVAVPRFDMPLVARGGLLVPAGIGPGGQACQEGSEQGFVLGQDAPVLSSGEGPARAVTLAAATAAGLFVSKQAARKAAQREEWEPVGGDKYSGYTYALTDLYEYQKAKGKR